MASFHPVWQQPPRSTATQSASVWQARNRASAPGSFSGVARALASPPGAPPAGPDGAEAATVGTAGGAAALAVALGAGATAGALVTGAVVTGEGEVCAQASAAQGKPSASSAANACMERGMDTAYIAHGGRHARAERKGRGRHRRR